jgi:lysophospholipase L1-like esterase
MPLLILIFLVAAVVVCYVLWAWNLIRVAIQRSILIEKTTVAYEQQPIGSTVQILVAGDSTAVGVGAKRSEDSVAGRIGKDVPNAAITNKGISGLKLSGLKSKLIELKDARYDLVVLQIGANDITGRTAYTEIRTTLIEVLDMAAVLGKKVVVLTAGNVGTSPAFAWPLNWYMTTRTRVVRRMFIAEIAKYPNTSYVDLFQELRDDDFSKDIERYYAPDFFHPSGDGYGLWYEKIRPVLNF